MSTTPPEEPGELPPVGLLGRLGIGSPRGIAVFVLCGAGAFVAARLVPESPDLPEAARRALFILLFASALWVTEAIPAFAVGIGVIGLQIALLGRPGGVFAETPRDWEQFVAVLGHPLIWLFFGGFVLAGGLSQSRLDRRLAIALLHRVGTKPGPILVAVMAITFVLSMFMSNTATTAMMLALIAPLLAQLESDDPFGAGLVLGVAIAANLGGMGSLIGTPPNAIAVGALADASPDLDVTFLEWLWIGLPPGVLLAGLGWALLTWLYPARVSELRYAAEGGRDEVPIWQTGVVATTVAATVGLWLTSGWHSIPTAAVSFLPIVVFTATGILGAREIRGLNYDVLFLLAGGLALGQVVVSTGLSDWIVSRLPVEGLRAIALALTLAYLTFALSNFMSNTAAANILVPIAITMAASFEAEVVLPIALAASAAMCLPVATPPNALAYATGRCTTRDFLRLGLAIGLITPLVAALWVRFLASAVVDGSN